MHVNTTHSPSLTLNPEMINVMTVCVHLEKLSLVSFVFLGLALGLASLIALARSYGSSRPSSQVLAPLLRSLARKGMGLM